MAFSYADFVDPQLGGFVWVHVVHARGKANDATTVEGDGQVMARIAQDFCCQVGIDSVVEHARRHRFQKRLIARSENSDLWAHGQLIA
jgi:hypothetical protein